MGGSKHLLEDREKPRQPSTRWPVARPSGSTDRSPENKRIWEASLHACGSLIKSIYNTQNLSSYFTGNTLQVY
jgi:hypothetical protein